LFAQANNRSRRAWPERAGKSNRARISIPNHHKSTHKNKSVILSEPPSRTAPASAFRTTTNPPTKNRSVILSEASEFVAPKRRGPRRAAFARWGDSWRNNEFRSESKDLHFVSPITTVSHPEPEHATKATGLKHAPRSESKSLALSEPGKSNRARISIPNHHKSTHKNKSVILSEASEFVAPKRRGPRRAAFARWGDSWRNNEFRSESKDLHFVFTHYYCLSP
jgi:hypothetical protein